jgi:hypothetical protein
MMATGKERRSATELIQIALAEIQKRQIERIYSINVSSTPYGGSPFGMWQLIINEIPLHEDDPVRKGCLERETPSEKQWRYSLIEVEQELQSRFELHDSKIQPRVEQGKFELQDSKTQPPVEKSFESMIGNQIAQLETRIETFLSVVDLYVDVIVETEQKSPGSVRLSLSDGKSLSASEISDVSLYMYSAFYYFAKSVVK